MLAALDGYKNSSNQSKIGENYYFRHIACIIYCDNDYAVNQPSLNENILII